MSTNALVFGSNWVVRLGIKQVLRRVGLTVLADGDRFAHVAKRAVADEPALVIGVSVPPSDRNQLVADMRSARAAYPQAPQVLIASILTPETLDDASRAGADGLLGLTMPSKLLLSSLELIVHGHKLYPDFPQGAVMETNQPAWRAQPSHANGCKTVEPFAFLPILLPNSPAIQPASRSHAAEPSEREWEILSCLATGGSNKEIARELGIAETTVKVHVKSVLRKLRLANRTQAAVWMHNHHRRPASQPSPPGD